MKITTELNEARAQKALDKRMDYSGEILSLREYLAAHEIVEKWTWTTYRSERETCLEKPFLAKPKVVHYLVWRSESGNRLIGVPKLVYDLYDVPESIHDNAYAKEEWEKEQRRKEAKKNDPFGPSFYLRR